jgi:hypothetical protein
MRWIRQTLEPLPDHLHARLAPLGTGIPAN